LGGEALIIGFDKLSMTHSVIKIQSCRAYRSRLFFKVSEYKMAKTYRVLKTLQVMNVKLLFL
jgi:hypothetical protein